MASLAVVDRKANIAIVDIAVVEVAAVVLGDDESTEDGVGDMATEAAVGDDLRNCCHNFLHLHHHHLLDREVASTCLCDDDNLHMLE